MAQDCFAFYNSTESSLQKESEAVEKAKPPLNSLICMNPEGHQSYPREHIAGAWQVPMHMTGMNSAFRNAHYVLKNLILCCQISINWKKSFF